jgi:hypothetical protein
VPHGSCCRLILCSKLLEPSVGSIEPPSFIPPAIITVQIVVWADADGGVVSRRTVELVVVVSDLAPGYFEVDRDVFLGGLWVSDIVHETVG